MSEDTNDNKWTVVTEDGQTSWWHEKLGGVVLAGDKYISEMPFVKVVKLGPFDTLEEAQSVVNNYQVINKAVDEAIEVANEELLSEDK